MHIKVLEGHGTQVTPTIRLIQQKPTILKYNCSRNMLSVFIAICTFQIE